jgi:hypothetical protein
MRFSMSWIENLSTFTLAEFNVMFQAGIFVDTHAREAILSNIMQSRTVTVADLR